MIDAHYKTRSDDRTNRSEKRLVVLSKKAFAVCFAQHIPVVFPLGPQLVGARIFIFEAKRYSLHASREVTNWTTFEI